MISGGSFETGMQVERLFEDKWYPAYVSRTSSYQGITDTVDLRYARGCFGEEEELNVSTSFLRHANFENQSPSSSAYSPPQSVMYGSRRPHKVWRIKQTPVEELMTRDDIGVRGLRKLRESRRGSSRYRSQSSPPCNTASLSSCRFHVSKNGSSSSVLAPKVDSSLEGLKPLCDRCERCGKHSIFRCFNCATTFYCSRLCQRKAWSKHQRLCCPQGSYKCRQPFVPLFTQESLGRLSLEMQRKVSSKGTSPSLASAFSSSFLALPPPNTSSVTEGWGDSMVHPLFADMKDADDDARVRELAFTGASDAEILRALKVYPNDMDAAANWLLKAEGATAEQEGEEVPSLISTSNKGLNGNEYSGSHSSARSPPVAGVTWRADDLNVGGVNAHGSNRDESSNGYAVPVGVDLTEDTKADGSKYGYYGPFCPIIQESCKDDMKADPPPTCAEAKGDLIDETAAQGLCEMLGVSFQDATDALRTFRDPNAAAEWFMLHPGETPPQRAASYIFPAPPIRTTQSRPPTPSSDRLGKDDCYNDID